MENEAKNAKSMAAESSFVDFALGGESHSPDSGKIAEAPAAKPEDSPAPPDQTANKDASKQGSPDVPAMLPEDEDSDGFEENPKPEEAPAKDDSEVNRLRTEIEVLNKRLHDTQSSFHRASEERAKMQRELEDLKKREGDDEDWFSKEDEKRKQELEAEINKADKELGESQSSIEEAKLKAAEITWDIAAAPVAAKHSDFEELVYDFLGAKLDRESGDPIIRDAWQKEPDKSPEKAYAFAKRLKVQEEILTDPDAYKERLRKEILNNAGGFAPTGKQGLDMVNSADPSPSVPDSGGFVDAVFK